MNLRKISPFLFLLILLISIAAGNSLLAQNILTVNKQEIKCGDSIIINYGKQFKSAEVLIQDPLGNRHFATSLPDANSFKVFFVTDSTKGFLTENWNKYSIFLKQNNQVIDSSVVRLANSEKTLYFTVFIDDIGPYGYINEEDYKWYRNKGGKFNLGYMKDDFGMDNLSEILKKYPNRSDYIFHHFHAQRFAGNQFLLKIYQLTRWKNFKTHVSKMLNIELRDRHFILFSIGLSTMILLFIFIFFRTRKIILTSVVLLLLFNVTLFSIIFVYVYVIDEDKKKVMLADMHWNKSFLLNKKAEFEQNGMNYPEITRHGWTIPPRGLGNFYLKEMGVMADQSLDYLPHKEKGFYKQDHGIELNQVFDYYVYDWPKNQKYPVPFYTNIDGDINQLWNGEEASRGIIEIPSTHGPYATQVYDEKDLKLCDSLPNGALVSCWGHPNKRMENVEPLLDYVQQNFDFHFVNIAEYLDIFLQNNPRPLFIDEENKAAYWAYLGQNEIKIIAQSNLVTFNAEQIQLNLVNLPQFIILKNLNEEFAEKLGYEFDRKVIDYFVGDYFVYSLKESC